MRREDMDAIEDARIADDTLEYLCDLIADLGLVVEAVFAVRHLATQIGTGIKPEPRRILGFVAGAIEIVQHVGKPIESVGVNRGCLTRLMAAQQNASAIEPADTGRAQCPETASARRGGQH